MTGVNTLFSIVMVGHSLFGNDGPDMLQSALRAGTGDATVQAQIINGAPLRHNWENSDKAEGVDARAVLPDGGVSHLILTEAVPLANHTQWSDTEVYAQAFAGLAFGGSRDVHVYVQETWHSLQSGTGVSIAHDAGADVPWRQRLVDDLPVWQDIASKVAAGNPDHAAQVGVIPAGQALGRLYDEIAAGDMDGLDSIDALFSDDIHLNDLGHYFVAMVQYGVLTGQSPLGLPTDFSDRWGGAFDTPDADLARALQKVAWDAVQAFNGIAVQPVPVATRSARADVAPTAPPVAALAVETPDAPPVTEGTKDVGIGLAAVSDWSTQVPFMDLMKTARPWIGHKPGQFGGMEHDELQAGGYLDADGWPLRVPRALSSIGTLVLTDMPQDAVGLKGRYVLRYSGKGIIEVAGRATGVRYGNGEIQFDYTPGQGSVEIRIQRINTAAPPRILFITKIENARRAARGEMFNPAWTARLDRFKTLRFMDWMETNDSDLTQWSDRPKPGDVTYQGGVPVEVMITLSNQLEKDAWINVPHLLDDASVRSMAELVRDTLDPARKVYVEFSNEVWNWQFAQATWADQQSRARWGEADQWMQFYGMRAAQVAHIWSEVFGDQAQDRLVNVISSQTGWLGLEAQALTAPLWVAQGGKPPVEAFDAYAVTGYFGGILGLEEKQPMVAEWLQQSETAALAAGQADGLKGSALARYVATHKYRAASQKAAAELRDGSVSGDRADTLHDLLTRVLPHHGAVARANGLDLLMYEGGSHVVGLGAQVDNDALTAFFHHFNYTSEMGDLYQTLLAEWTALGGQLFMAYSDVYAPTKWGSWGGLRHLDDSNPRWDALIGYE